MHARAGMKRATEKSGQCELESSIHAWNGFTPNSRLQRRRIGDGLDRSGERSRSQMRAISVYRRFEDRFGPNLKRVHTEPETVTQAWLPRAGPGSRSGSRGMPKVGPSDM